MRQNFSYMSEQEEKIWRDFGDWIESYRILHRLSQEGAAQRAGITRQTWIYVIRGHRTKRSTVVNMARAVGADVAEALERVGFKALPSDLEGKNGKTAEFDEEFTDAEMANFISRVKKLRPEQRRDFKIFWKAAQDYVEQKEKENRDNLQ